MVKRLLFFAGFLGCFSVAIGQTNQWTWVQGDSVIPYYAIYGVKGVESPGNIPGGRKYALRWKGADGSLWIYGGNGNTLTQTYSALGDLWKYSPISGLWTCIKGDSLASPKTVYGTKGVAAPGNTPGVRAGSSAWTDSTGNLWLFGKSDGRSDFWKYSPVVNQWTWMGGDTLINQQPVYTTKGVPSSVGRPGSRAGAVTWVDKFGTFWLFGGGSFGDLWKYNFATEQWTWVAGQYLYGVATVPGTQGVPAASNQPGYRTNAVTWTDSTGNLWMYGGSGSSASSSTGNLADLWRFTPADGYWTWMTGSPYLGQTVSYGTRGVANVNNHPGSRTDATGVTDSSGNFWLFGGAGAGTDGSTVFNDLWKYNPATNLWTWMKGTYTINTIGFNGTKGVPDPGNLPGGRQGSVSWFDASGKLWMFGGIYANVYQAPFMNDLWQYNLTTDQWTWLSGDNNNSSRIGIYGTKGITASGNKPGERIQSMSWTDGSGNFWLFGGLGYAHKTLLGTGPLNDLWKWSPATGLWTWLHGDTATYSYASYGTLGVAANTNKPGARYGSTGWTDAACDMWMFGGNGQTNVQPGPAAGASGTLNDLWKYTPATNQWTFIKGFSLARQPGFYGTKGVAAATNIPAPRENAVGWKDASGNYWLFGGVTDALSGFGYLNDLWMYSPATNQWTWKSGDATTNQTGIYGMLGTAALTNKPGARQNAVAWTDASGNLWLFGGSGTNSTSSYFNDLWKYDLSTGLWTWMAGDNTLNKDGIYGMKGVAAASNKPSAREGAVGWTDNSGNFWLFGGQGLYSLYNDLWTYSPVTLQWTWMGGDNINDQTGSYGTVGIPSPANKPGARYQAIGWKDLAGNLRLWGGTGYGANGYGTLYDSWVYTPAAASLPVQFSSFTIRKESTRALLSWTTAQEQNSREFIIERSADGTAYTRIGTVPASGTVNTPTSYAFTDPVPLAGTNLYRVKEVDLDGKTVYSSVQKVYFDGTAARLQVWGNPVQNKLQLQTQLPFAQPVNLEIRDAAGHLLIKKIIKAGQGTVLNEIAVDGLANGMYFVHAGSESLDNTCSFIKQ